VVPDVIVHVDAVIDSAVDVSATLVVDVDSWSEVNDNDRGAHVHGAVDDTRRRQPRTSSTSTSTQKTIDGRRHLVLPIGLTTHGDRRCLF